MNCSGINPCARVWRNNYTPRGDEDETWDYIYNFASICGERTQCVDFMSMRQGQASFYGF